MSMTVEEAIAKFKRTSVLWESASNTEMVEAVKVAIAALEEVQQYRAIIGLTPEDLKALEKDEIQTIGDALKAFAEWSQYKEIGTAEEFRQTKEGGGKCREKIKNFLEENPHFKIAIQHLGISGGGFKVQLYNTTWDYTCTEPAYEHFISDFEISNIRVDFETTIIIPVINWWEEIKQRERRTKRDE